jgi:uncharacterized protein (TIGR03083 family)
MRSPLPFPELLRRIEERSVAFRDAISAAPGLDALVPTCPDWTVLDLALHLGFVHRRWAVIVSEGPSASGSVGEASPDPSHLPSDRDAVLRWSAESTVELLRALSRSGPDTGCWTWWGDSQSPQTSGAVARHQLVEVAVHAYDAQVAVGERQTLSLEVAVDGIEEFLSTSCSGTAAWPYEPATVDYLTDEGAAWRLSLSASGSRVRPLDQESAPFTSPPIETHGAYACLAGGASDVLLALYGRVDVGSLTSNGDGRVFDQLIEWDSDA